ncbi:Helix-turn-helix domain protein [Geobacillus sp. BCO2]|nr:Helix-turn-helix domain protein [Geobacillus sp. BCO2]
MVKNETFKLIRLYFGMSQRDFAKHIGVSPATVGLIEANCRPVSEYVRAKLAAKFNLTDEFLDYIENYRKLSQH